jgi:hypothetical protein
MKSSLIVVLLLLSGSMYSQNTTRFTPFLNSNWSNPLNWSNGKPSANDTAIVQVFISNNCRINENAVVHDIYHEDGGTITIESGNTLTVNGDFHLSNNSSIINNGKLEINGSIYKDGISRLQVFSSIQLEGSISFD